MTSRRPGLRARSAERRPGSGGRDGGAEDGAPADRGSPAPETAAEARGGARPTVGPAVWIAGGLMLLVGAATAALMLIDVRPRSYLYLAFYSIPSNAAISIFPHEPVLLYFGKFANLWVAAGAATAGTLVAGWMDHAVFVPVLHLRALRGYRSHRLYRKAIALYRRWPFLTLVLAGLTPLPFFPFKFLSFSTAYPVGRYLAALAVSRFPRYLVLLWAGAVLAIPDGVLVALFAAVLAFYLWRAGPEVVRRIREERGPDARRRGDERPGEADRRGGPPVSPASESRAPGGTGAGP